MSNTDVSDVEESIYKDKLIYKALYELDDRLYKLNVAPFDLRVVGGFAIILNGITHSDKTDIDYVGDDFNFEIREIIDDVGIEYGLGRGWINNDVLMSGSTLEDFEFSVGKLNFIHKEDLKVIRIYALDKECLLRMKVIALDTAWMSSDVLGEFIRLKDINDILLIADSMGYNFRDVYYATNQYVLSKEIYYLIRYMFKYRTNILTYEQIKDIIATKGKVRVE